MTIESPEWGESNYYRRFSGGESFAIGGMMDSCRSPQATAAVQALLRLIAERLEHGDAVPGPMNISFIAA
jgi:hypothetical protein